MANLRTQVAKVQISGTIGSGSAPAEIWSTSFWVAAYGSGGPGNSPDDMGTFDPADYITNHVVQFVNAVMAYSPSVWIAKLIKCNLVGLAGYKVKQVSDPTIESAVNIPGQQQNGYTTNVTSLGWRLQTTTASRGVATQGRMFLPAAVANHPGAFDADGHWGTDVVAAASAGLTGAWDNLAAGNTGIGGLSYIPSVVTVPSVKNGLTKFACNAADITTVENNVWVVRTRKNKLPTGGTTTRHPSFS